MTEKKDSWKQIKIRTHYFLALILFMHCLFFIIYWVAIGNFRHEVNQFAANAVGIHLPFVTVLIILTVFIGIWSLIRFFRMRHLVQEKIWKPSGINWIYFGVWVAFIVIFYLSFTIILQRNHSQWGVLIHLINITRLVLDAFLFLLAAVWLRRLIVFLRQKMNVVTPSWPLTIGIVLSLVLLVALWLIPAIFPPNWAYQSDLPSKPALIAHRGASMLAPENTLAAAELAAVNQALGFETDLRISLDGTPFLMHDDTLERTTNIAEVYPERVSARASSFTLEELKALNAGLWFIQKDPYNTIESGLVSQSQLGINQGQTIPTLSETLEVVQNEDLILLFDLRYPPEDHPYRNEFFNIVFQECRESGMNGDIWFLADTQQLEVILEEAPQMTRVVGVNSKSLPDPEALVNLQYEIVNVDAGIRTADVQAYRQRGLGVNVYTIDQPWLFSQFWLTGVTSITTNNVHTFNEVDAPFINIPYARYILFWGLYGIIVAIWLASSQPEQPPEIPQEVKTPDLMDFATEDDVTLNASVPENSQPAVVTQPATPDTDDEKPEEPGYEDEENSMMEERTNGDQFKESKESEEIAQDENDKDPE